MDYKIFNAENIGPFCNGDYQSRLLLDHAIAAEKAVNINDGTVVPGGRTAAAGSTGASYKKASLGDPDGWDAERLMISPESLRIPQKQM